MDRCIRLIGFFVLLIVLSFGSLHAQVKEPDVAGDFYPADKQELSALLEKFLSQSEPDKEGTVTALIVPHAGYRFSGKTAGKGYCLVKAKNFSRVIILAPSHRRAFKGIALFPGSAFRTPLGPVEVDKELSRRLLSFQPASFDIRPFEKEHSLEVQLPFLQKTLKDFQILPVIMGDMGLDECERFGSVIGGLMRGRDDILLVLSSDMYHGYDQEAQQSIDRHTLSCLEGMDPGRLHAGVAAGTMQLCGSGPVISGMYACRDLGGTKLTVLHSTDSGRETGNRRAGAWTVGYSACAIYRKRPVDRDRDDRMLNNEQRKRLLDIARRSIETYLKTGKKLSVNEKDPMLISENGAFVTLRGKDGQLRGCIGNMVGHGPLCETIRDMAVEAAVNDYRFSSMKLSELPGISIEISVLSPMKKVASADEITVGTHGVMVKRGMNSGVYLPQVAEETGWTKEEFLSSLCGQKAGLPSDAWKDPKTELYTFTAEVFGEK